MANANLKEAKLIDFTGNLPGFKHFSAFGGEVVSLIRSGSGPKVLVVVDRGFHFQNESPYVVRDHLNLMGTNPLVGANDPCGERFPSVNNVYIEEACGGLPLGVAAGLKAGVRPGPDEVSLVRSLGADFFCYNVVPTMIIAAHAGYKVLAIVAPDGVDVAPVVESALREENN